MLWVTERSPLRTSIRPSSRSHGAGPVVGSSARGFWPVKAASPCPEPATLAGIIFVLTAAFTGAAPGCGSRRYKEYCSRHAPSNTTTRGRQSRDEGQNAATTPDDD